MSSPLSGFTAIPNPQMLAFMGAQSFIMMFQAGEGWQYGKRRISAMSNEEFNELTPELVLEKQAVVLKNSLATIEQSMNNMTPMVGTIVKQYGDFIAQVINNLPEAAKNAFGGINISLFGAGSGSGKLGPGGSQAGFLTPFLPTITQLAELEAAQKAQLTNNPEGRTGLYSKAEQADLDRRTQARILDERRKSAAAFERTKGIRLSAKEVLSSLYKSHELVRRRISSAMSAWQSTNPSNKGGRHRLAVKVQSNHALLQELDKQIRLARGRVPKSFRQSDIDKIKRSIVTSTSELRRLALI